MRHMAGLHTYIYIYHKRPLERRLSFEKYVRCRRLCSTMSTVTVTSYHVSTCFMTYETNERYRMETLVSKSIEESIDPTFDKKIDRSIIDRSIDRGIGWKSSYLNR